MHVAVFAKQIPDPEQLKLDPERRTIVRQPPFVLDDSDTFSVEMGLQLAESSGGEVLLISMAPGGESSGLMSALAMGAARALVVSDGRLSGSDALSTAKVLAAAVRRSGADLVLAATESTDGYSGTVPVQVAELLSWPSVSFARHVEARGDELWVERQTEGGYDLVRCTTPLVVSVTAGVVEPRYPTFKGIMSAKSKPVEVLDLEALGCDPASVGAGGARQEVVAVAPGPQRPSGESIEDDGSAHERIIAMLEELKLI